MTLKIKNQKLVKSNKERNGVRLIEIKRNVTPSSIPTKLSEVLDFLPSGFVFKEETGIGATTLELTCNRNSIIVEPIKITASSKAKSHQALYVGSPTKYHKKSPSKADIQNYINDITIKYKKIVVVADSLPRVIDVIGENVFVNYFLLLDEIDSFQLDSSYRKSMETCIEKFLKFDSNKRAMLSATKIDFTDPVLKKEPITEFRYDIKQPRKINVLTTNASEIRGVVIDKITEIIKMHPGEKIFVAYNSVGNCLNLAQHLVDNNSIRKDEIKILCSSASKNSANDFYNELDSDLLPGTINFFTSAYFTGFDLNEQYHLVAVSGNRNKVHALSDRRMKQISGRSRKGLLSETIIHDIASGQLKDDFNESEFIAAANEQVNSHNCMKKHYSKNPLLKLFINDINEQFLKVLEENELKLIRKDESGDFKISYLNIDAALESIRVRKQLYQNPNDLSNQLQNNGEMVIHTIVNSSTVVQDKKISIQERDRQAVEIIDVLKKASNEEDIQLEISSSRYTIFQEKIAKDYSMLIGFLEADSTLDLMKNLIIGKKDLREYNRMINSAIFYTFSDTHLTVNRFNIQFPLGIKYKQIETVARVNLALNESQVKIELKTQRSAVRLLRTFFVISRNRDKKTGIDFLHIKGKNPYNFKILKTKKNAPDDSLFKVVNSFF